ncbi:phage tail assembly chaperone [Cellulosilyticum sp. WCF-2]|uniref:phage tail assembly chaperone n=1 Tax=Cellulosilyticum sp. WCF-2 TaxID=2497860 RepID=UPI000F8E4973|nr:phage portal protein [Cellulosilyticum sp. WCF-2]QEH69914.1 phage portal protein [Cellulosilyticum sp. WCF-2]
MSGLSVFFAENVEKNKVVKYVASKRFKDEKGNPVEWQIGCVTSDEDEAIRKSCTRKVPIPGKKNAYMPETDFESYLGKLAVRCITYPNLNDVELQNSYGVMGADKLLKTMLKPGEYQDLLKKIQEVNGFDETMEDMVEEAKN